MVTTTSAHDWELSIAMPIPTFQWWVRSQHQKQSSMGWKSRISPNVGLELIEFLATKSHFPLQE